MAIILITALKEAIWQSALTSIKGGKRGFSLGNESAAVWIENKRADKGQYYWEIEARDKTGNGRRVWEVEGDKTTMIGSRELGEAFRFAMGEKGAADLGTPKKPSVLGKFFAKQKKEEEVVTESNDQPPASLVIPRASKTENKYFRRNPIASKFIQGVETKDAGQYDSLEDFLANVFLHKGENAAYPNDMSIMDDRSGAGYSKMTFSLPAEEIEALQASEAKSKEFLVNFWNEAHTPKTVSNIDKSAFVSLQSAKEIFDAAEDAGVALLKAEHAWGRVQGRPKNIDGGEWQLAKKGEHALGALPAGNESRVFIDAYSNAEIILILKNQFFKDANELSQFGESPVALAKELIACIQAVKAEIPSRKPSTPTPAIVMPEAIFKKGMTQSKLANIFHTTKNDARKMAIDWKTTKVVYVDFDHLDLATQRYVWLCSADAYDPGKHILHGASFPHQHNAFDMIAAAKREAAQKVADQAAANETIDQFAEFFGISKVVHGGKRADLVFFGNRDTNYDVGLNVNDSYVSGSACGVRYNDSDEKVHITDQGGKNDRIWPYDETLIRTECKKALESVKAFAEKMGHGVQVEDGDIAKLVEIAMAIQKERSPEGVAEDKRLHREFEVRDAANKERLAAIARAMPLEDFMRVMKPSSNEKLASLKLINTWKFHNPDSGYMEWKNDTPQHVKDEEKRADLRTVFQSWAASDLMTFWAESNK